VERIALGIGAEQFRRSIGVNGPEHMLVGEEVGEAQVFDRSPKSPNGGGISSKFVLGICDADVHEVQFLMSLVLVPEPPRR